MTNTNSCNVVRHDILVTTRNLVAEALFQAYNFGPDYSVEASNGWQTDGDEMNRTVFLQTVADTDADTCAVVICLRFEPDSQEISEVDACFSENSNGLGDFDPPLLDGFVAQVLRDNAAALPTEPELLKAHIASLRSQAAALLKEADALGGASS